MLKEWIYLLFCIESSIRVKSWITLLVPQSNCCYQKSEMLSLCKDAKYMYLVIK
jgi:hypothetical protein